MMAVSWECPTPLRPPCAGENDGFAVTYYPGTASSEDAQPVTVGIAEEAAAAFALIPARMTRISGIVRSSAGIPVVRRLFDGAREGNRGCDVTRRRATGADGSFTLNNLAPGDHWIEVYPRLCRRRVGQRPPDRSVTEPAATSPTLS